MNFLFNWLHKSLLLLILGLLGWGLYLRFNKPPKPKSLPAQNNFQNKTMIIPNGQIVNNLLPKDQKSLTIRPWENNLKIYHLSLGINAGMNEVISWLKEHFPNKQFLISHFSYGLYNESDKESLVSFNRRLKEPVYLLVSY